VTFNRAEFGLPEIYIAGLKAVAFSVDCGLHGENVADKRHIYSGFIHHNP
jgi:hypothetical protein